MSKRYFASTLAALLLTVLVASPLLLAVPQRAHAILGVPSLEVNPVVVADDSVTAAETTLTTIESTLDAIYNFTSMVAEYAQWVNTYILQPLAFVLSGQLMKALTASVMKFVIGKANGTGIPQFATDVQKSLRSISDFQKNAYLRQVRLTNSPFASSIAQALGIDYNQNTSLAGYWRANMNTLGKNIPTYSPNFLNGSWSQGGTAAWFQLTTQTQNNPYMLYQSAQSKLAAVIGPGVGGGTGARLNQLQWGQGFMSWCNSTDTATQNQNDASTGYQACIAQCDSAPGGYTAACADSCGTSYTQSGGIIAGGGINPGDPCTKSDGTAGTIQTPGSTIKATLDKVLGGQQDKLVQMGNISSQISGILGNIGTILNTVNLAANILGGSSSGGLLNAGQPSGALTRINSPVTVTSSERAALTTGYGTSESQLNAAKQADAVTTARNTDTSHVAADANAAAADAAAAGVAGTAGATGGGSTTSTMLTRVQQYQTAWNAIAAAANATKAALQTDMSTCHAYLNGNSTYENAMQNAISFEIVPVLTQASDAQTTAAAATTQYNLVQSESTTASTYQTDLAKLNSMPPTASDVANAQYNATAYGGATANPVGSLTVSGSSIVDQMNLISNNAASIVAQSCTAPVNGGGG